MNVLLCGSSGFIGRNIAKALVTAGHRVMATRSPAGSADAQAIAVDFSRDTDPAIWLARLKGVDAVVNAVGVLRDTRQRPIQVVHTEVPKALYTACAQAGVRRVVHVSALGIEGSNTAYAQTKLAAERHLLGLTEQGLLDGVVLRPSVVFGANGDSSKLFVNLAQLPVLMLPQAMIRARIQPVAVGDLALAIARLLQESRSLKGILPCVGATPLSMADFIGSLRQQLGKGKALVMPLPGFMTTLSARIGDQIPALPFCTETLSLLEQDNVAPVQAFTEVLGRRPIGHQDLVKTSWH
ncbi:epimerase [Aquabacterium sp. NJ1]|uniref:NAD-dependent epimerase/dehydratase family protein n=1 Tax=Aquabacterium sp. NJ1 TaxID=1538295 RepID=UPI00052C8C25|nr:NAD-dependent epimerase/dehydratase family protein [Aquabacterium sp. NJ1]KGM41304.1 epimerase [Aquabacterium sp. NJ1]